MTLNRSDMKTEVKIGDIISFVYKGGRKVKLSVYSCDGNRTVGTLLTDYIGKNVEWYKGEVKDFNTKEMKGVIIKK